MLEILAVFKALPGKEDALRKATLAVVAPTLAEAGCRRFDAEESADEPGLFFLRETWVDDAALQNHFKQPYLVDLVEQHKTLLDGPLKLHKLTLHK